MTKQHSSATPTASKPTPPKKPAEPVVRRIVNERVINRESALGDANRRVAHQ